MSDNRFKDYPTKRIPSLNQRKGNEMHHSPIDHDEYDDYEDYDDYDDESIEPIYDTKPAQRRQSPLERTDTRYSRRTEENRSTRLRQSRQVTHENRPRKRTGGNPPNRRNQAKTAFTAIYIGLLVIAVAVCITILVFLVQWLAREGPNPADLIPDREHAANGENGNEQTLPPGRPDIRNMTTMITGINSDPRSLVMLNLDTMLTDEIPLSDEAEFTDRRGNEITFSQLRIGQLVNISYDARMPVITVVRENPRSWERAERTNVHVNIENLTISVGHEAFEFNSQTLVLHRGEPINISQIRPADSVTITGVGSTAWMVQLDASSGLLLLSNTDAIVNGRITVGNLHPLFLDEITGSFDVAEGPHRVVVEGDNIETFIENIVITHGQTFNLDLGIIEVSTATLNITTTPVDANIFINNELVTSPAQVSFGEHNIRVERDGYVTQERVVNVTNSTDNIQFNLEPVVHYARLTINATPANAEIFVGNILVGRANPSMIIEIAPGSYTIIARMYGYLDYTFNITLTSGQETTRSVILSPILVSDPGDTNDNESPSGGFTIPPPPPPIR